MLRLEGLSLSYAAGPGSGPAGVIAVEAAEAVFPAGAISAIIGPSGCGKTSLVRAMAGLRKPSAGRVLVEDRELEGVRDRTAVIFQDFGLLPWKSVEANVELPLLLRGIGSRERRERAAPLLEELGLSAFARFYPAALSGGMRQRVAVARALVSGPDLLLMDEPFSSLDALTRESMQETLLEVQRRRGTTVVLVTHSIEEAVYLAGLVYVMAGRNPGRISARIETGTGEAARGPSYRAEPRFLELTSELRRNLEAGRLAAGETR
jgi:ABC-type nitrate/sulfonate/bicarbonate transport system ATPase subunit